jgi:hypothetical protein
MPMHVMKTYQQALIDRNSDKLADPVMVKVAYLERSLKPELTQKEHQTLSFITFKPGKEGEVEPKATDSKGLKKVAGEIERIRSEIEKIEKGIVELDKVGVALIQPLRVAKYQLETTIKKQKKVVEGTENTEAWADAQMIGGYGDKEQTAQVRSAIIREAARVHKDALDCVAENEIRLAETNKKLDAAKPGLELLGV